MGCVHTYIHYNSWICDTISIIYCTQDKWKSDLKSFLEQNFVYFRFILGSDDGVEDDGYNREKKEKEKSAEQCDIEQIRSFSFYQTGIIFSLQHFAYTHMCTK